MVHSWWSLWGLLLGLRHNSITDVLERSDAWRRPDLECQPDKIDRLLLCNQIFTLWENYFSRTGFARLNNVGVTSRKNKHVWKTWVANPDIPVPSDSHGIAPKTVRNQNPIRMESPYWWYPNYNWTPVMKNVRTSFQHSPMSELHNHFISTVR